MNIEERYKWLTSKSADPDHVKRFYESVYRGCLNPFQRLKRFATHKVNGDRRFK